MQISESSNGLFYLQLEFIKSTLLHFSRGWTIHFHTCTILFSCNRRTLSTYVHNFLQLRKFLSYKKPLLKIRVIQLHHVPQFGSSIWKHNHLSSPWGIKWTTDGQQTGTIFLKYFKDAHLDEVIIFNNILNNIIFNIKTSHSPHKYLFVIKEGE